MQHRARHLLQVSKSYKHDQHIDTKSYVDARFEVLGSSFSLLSASISASQYLYTRKGTLVGFNGQPENVQHTPQPSHSNDK